MAGLNPKQRAFVMLVAQGKSQSDAYIEAYGKPATFDRNQAKVRASVIANNREVKAELDRLKADVMERVRVAAAAKHAISVEYVMGRLHEVAERCLQHRPVLDGRGKPVLVLHQDTPDGPEELRAVYTFDAKGAVNALVPLGKQLGMFVDRKEIRTGPLPDKSDADLDAMLSVLVDDLAVATGVNVADLLKQISAVGTTHGTALALQPPALDPPPPPPGGQAEAQERVP